MTTTGEVNSLATRVATEFKTIRTLLSGSATGDVSGLTTTATNIVAAINEVLDVAEAAAGGGVTESEAQTLIDASIATLVGGAPGALDTLNELAAAINDDASFAATITTSLGLKANDADVVHDTGNETIAGIKTFSSSPVVPDGSFAIAKTTGLQSALDAKAPLASPTFTGTPLAPTQGTASTSNTQIATTAFVQAAIDAKLGDSTTNFVTTFEAGLV